MARRFVTAEDVARLERGARIELDAATTVTESARELARRRGVELVPVTAEAPAIPSGQAGPAGEGEASAELGVPAPGLGGTPAGTVIASAVGVNRPGVLAELAGAVGSLGGDIQDLNQRITGGYFNTTLIVDISASGHSFSEFRDALTALSKQSDYVVTVIDQRVFRAMHRL